MDRNCTADETVSLVIKDSDEEDLYLVNQQLLQQLNEAHERIRLLENQMLDYREALDRANHQINNNQRKKSNQKLIHVSSPTQRCDADTDTAANVLSTLGDSSMKKRSRLDMMTSIDGDIQIEEHEIDDNADSLDNTFESLGGTKAFIKPKFCFSESDDRKILEAHSMWLASDPQARHSEHGLLKKWQYVADYLSNGCTAHQVGRRWRERLDPALSCLKSGTFSPEEDERLLKLIKEHMADGRGGGKNWTCIAQKMNRRAKECEHRGATLMNKHTKTGSFTPEEDQLLVKLHNEGKSIQEIAKMLNRKPKRCADRLEATVGIPREQ